MYMREPWETIVEYLTIARSAIFFQHEQLFVGIESNAGSIRTIKILFEEDDQAVYIAIYFDKSH